MSSNREIWNPMTGSGRSENQENNSMQKPGLVKYSENIAVSPFFVIIGAHRCNKLKTKIIFDSGCKKDIKNC